jgi:hypothetical protein
MKLNKIVVLFVAILLMAGLAIAATPGRDISPGRGDIAGNLGRYDSDAQKTFRLVRYVPASGSANSATLSADSLVIWDLVSDDGVTVTTTTTSASGAVAGIIVNAALTPATLGNTAKVDEGGRNWTWLQTYGLANVTFGDDAVIAAGASFGTDNAAGLASGFIGTAAVGRPAGFVYDAVTASASDVQVFVVCE